LTFGIQYPGSRKSDFRKETAGSGDHRLNALENKLNAMQKLTLGIVSDTHGHLHPAIERIFDKPAAIIHAGDVGGPEILNALRKMAPVVAVRGNMDAGGWASALPALEIITAGGLLLHVLHDGQKLDLDPVAAGIRVIITGHTHRPSIKETHGVLYINPGSASLPRSGHGPSVALLSITRQVPEARIVMLDAPR
jgi:putative phosphoesterase